MATAPDTLISSVPKTAEAHSFAAGRAVALLLTVNAIPLLVLPVVIGYVNGRHFTQADLLPYFLIGLISILPAQLFLLAFWMAFAAWPHRWRTVSIFAITVACGLYFGVTFAALQAASPAANPPDAGVLSFVVIVISPIMASGLLWMLAAIFIIPAWCFRYEICLRSREPPPSAALVKRARTFSLKQLLIWTAQVAMPLGALNLFLTITEDRAAALSMISPFLVVLVACTPLTVALLTPSLSPGPVLLASAWCLVLALAIWTIPNSQYTLVPWQAVFVFAVTISGNLVALRWIGFCWRVRAA